MRATSLEDISTASSLVKANNDIGSELIWTQDMPAYCTRTIETDPYEEKLFLVLGGKYTQHAIPSFCAKATYITQHVLLLNAVAMMVHQLSGYFRVFHQQQQQQQERLQRIDGGS